SRQPGCPGHTQSDGKGGCARSQPGLVFADTLPRRGPKQGHGMSRGLSRGERAALERAQRPPYRLPQAPRCHRLPEQVADAAAPASAGPSVGMEKASPRRLLTLPTPPFAVRVLNNTSHGATPESIAEFNGLGSSDLARLTTWVDRQLNPAAIDD